MSKHTPKPWHIDGNPEDGRIVTEFVDDRIEVWTGGERTAHDVRLIVRAPDLLEACSDIELRCTQARLASTIGKQSGQKQADFLRSELERIAVVAREAVAKAEGRD